MTERVALAYSGGLDTSVAARSLREERGLDVVACFVDLGQPYDPAEVEARAAAAHADLVVVDARDRFAEEACLPAVHANALYEGKYPLVSALARPVIADEVIRVAREAGAGWVAHGCTGKGNDQVRFEVSFGALAPDLGVMAPIREVARSRAESLDLAGRWGIPLPSEAKAYSVDENLWGRTVEAGELEDPWAEPPADAFALTADPRTAPDDPAEVVVTFEGGRPVAMDGERLGLVELIARVTSVAGAHGFGRVDMIENRLVGIKSRELYEVPGALALIAAHGELEDLTLERDLAHEKALLERRWAELCYYGLWHGPLHAALRAFMAETQDRVSGEVRLRFHKGSCAVVGRRSPESLYDVSLATYEQGADRFDHRQAEGFVRLWGMPIRVWAQRGGGPGPVGSPSATTSGAPEPVGSPSATPVPSRPAPARLSEPATPTWGARFAGSPSPDTKAFLDSLPVDRRLLVHDLRATAAHVDALHRAGLLDGTERHRVMQEIEALSAAPETFPFEADEDVHSAVERVLTERLGPLGAKVHAGRSRNDLVATDLRLWVKDAAAGLAGSARALVAALADRAEEHADTIMPGYTHLQRAQPVTLGHHLLAHAFPLLRDAERLDRAASAADTSPLGAGALATSTLGLDPAATAASLGMSAAFDNAIDAVSDRDFALELLAACTITAVHLSRLAEDVVLWCSQEFGFATPPDEHATGSSMMPHKRNPDVAELARGKTGRILGDLVRLVTVLKGLPLAYDRDLQEDKEAVFDAHDALAQALDAMAGMIRGLTFHPERMAAAAADPALLATDIAERLVREGVPFREAHAAVAGVVKRLEDEGRTLGDVKPDEWADLDPCLGPWVENLLDPERSVTARSTAGGPSAASIEAQVASVRARLR